MSIGNSTSEKMLSTAIAARMPVMLVGDPGTSKTAMIRSIANDINYKLITVVPSRMDSQDISGFPTKGQYTYDDMTVPVTEYAPQLWQIEIMKEKKVVLFLDEFSNAHPSVRASLLSFIQDRQFPNGDMFPEETVIVAAMNPTDSAADGYELDPATTNRMLFISWKPSVDSWLKGMRDNWGEGVSSKEEKEWRNNIVRFIRDEPGALHMMPNSGARGEVYGVNTNDASDMAVLQYSWASRRSWDNLARVLAQAPKGDSQLEDALMSGIVGFRAASQFRDWLRKNGAVDVSKILENPRDFNGWAELEMDDLNLILRSAVDGIDQDSNKQKIMNLIDVFDIISDEEVDRMNLGAPFLQQLAGSSNRSRVLSGTDKSEIKARLQVVIKKFREVVKHRN